MASRAQKQATVAHRLRASARGLTRVEVQAGSRDAKLIRKLAKTLRDDTERARNLREALARALSVENGRDAFAIFGSELPDEAFDGVFEQPRETGWPPVSL